MPFYTIDWARYVNHSDSRGTVDAASTINDVTRITRKIWKFSGHWLGYKLTKKYRWARVCHSILLFLLLLSTLTAAIVSFLYWRPLSMDFVTVQRITLTLLYCQCVACNMAFLGWQLRQRFKAFNKLMNAATMGIGLIRQKERLGRVQYVLLVGFGLWALVLMAYHALGIFLPDHLANIPYPWDCFFWLDQLQPLSLLLVIYAAFNWFMAHVLLANYYAFLTAEIQSLNNDLTADSNLYQVAVLKHYTLIYHRLTHVNRHLNCAFGPLLTLTTATNYLILILNSLLFYTQLDKMDRAEIIFASVAIAMTAIYLIVFTGAALVLRTKGEYFFDVVQDVVAMDWNLDAEYYPVAACNAAYGKPLPFGIAFGTSWTITGRLFVQMALGTGTVLILLLIRIG